MAQQQQQLGVGVQAVVFVWLAGLGAEQFIILLCSKHATPCVVNIRSMPHLALHKRRHTPNVLFVAPAWRASLQD